MKKRNYYAMLEQAVRVDGLQFCLDALQEECAELIQKISHLRRGRCKNADVLREMADVQIMLDLAAHGFATGRKDLDTLIHDKATTIGEIVRFKDGKKGFSKRTKAVARATVGDSGYVKGAVSRGPHVPHYGDCPEDDSQVETGRPVGAACSHPQS